MDYTGLLCLWMCAAVGVSVDATWPAYIAPTFSDDTDDAALHTPRETTDDIIDLDAYNIAADSEGVSLDHAAHVDPPIESVDTPTESVKTPIESVDTSTEFVGTLIESVGTPVESVDTSIEYVDTSIEYVDTPIMSVDTPTTEIDDSQFHDIAISIRDADSMYILPEKDHNEHNMDVGNTVASADGGRSDDEDLVAGSGSGDVIIQIEDGTYITNATVGTNGDNTTVRQSTTAADRAADAAELDVGDDVSDDAGTLPTDTRTHNGEPVDAGGDSKATTDAVLPQFCDELANATWSQWSPWIQSGDVDIRIRGCHGNHGYGKNDSRCDGKSVETRPCRRRDAKTCRTSIGDVTEEYHLQCDGIPFNDIMSIDELRHPDDRADDCQYTLYDLKYGMAIGRTLSSAELAAADPALWCRHDDKYLPFYTPNQRCLHNLSAFCQAAEVCRYGRGRETRRGWRHTGDRRRGCWEKFVFGGIRPVGLPDNGGHMICQRLDKNSQLGKLLGHKDEHFATVYDTVRRMPIVSMATIRSLGEEKWPNVPFMIERALIKDDSSVISWFFKNAKKGMARLADVTDSCDRPACHVGEWQALPTDYDYSGYRTMPLVTPDLIGGNLADRISTFTLTNTVPLEPTVYAAWNGVLKAVRKFALNECHIPEVANIGDEIKSRNGHELPEMYLISGAIASSSHVEVIGNDVTVPQTIWLAACCAHGAHVASFGVYAYNQYKQRPIVISVQNLEAIIEASLDEPTNKVNVNIFPAFDGICSAIENDYSFNIAL